MTGRGLAGRRSARRMLFAAVTLDAFVVFLFVSAPSTMGGPLFPPPPVVWIVPAFGVVLNVAGLVWMVRIERRVVDPERGRSSWRAFRS